MKITDKIVLSFDENEKVEDVFRAKLRYLMMINDMSQRDLANELGYNQTTIASILIGRTGISLEKREILANYFGYSLSDMFSKDDFIIEQETVLDISRKVKTFYERRKELANRCKSE